MWLQRFDDSIEECETMGATVTDNMKRIYLMQNVNERIFEQTLVLWRVVLTHKSFPNTYDALKAYITNEYSSQMTQSDRGKVIYNVISHGKKKTELSMQAGESQKGDDKSNKGKCHMCGHAGHKMKKCWYYDPTKSLEENQKIAQEKIKAKKEAAKRKKQDDAKTDEVDKGKSNDDKWVPHKGTQVQLPPKTEQAGMCLV
jgi:hypothetical protein